MNLSISLFLDLIAYWFVPIILLTVSHLYIWGLYQDSSPQAVDSMVLIISNISFSFPFPLLGSVKEIGIK